MKRVYVLVSFKINEEQKHLSPDEIIKGALNESFAIEGDSVGTVDCTNFDAEIWDLEMLQDELSYGG